MTALREIRQRAGVSQVALAKKLGVTSSTVTQWESGVRKPDIVMVKKIANVFGVTVDELLAPIKID
ncbi:MAG: helix-turn-helix domain-containing protein [Oscillospiraceae bacterium]